MSTMMATATAATDDELAAAARTGDKDAVAELYRRYYPKMVGWLRKCSAVEHPTTRDVDAEDIAQDVFLRMMTTIGDYQPRPGTPFAAWLFGVVGKITLSEQHYRCRNHHTTIVVEIDRLQRSATSADTSAVDLGEVEQALSPTVADALGRLTPSQRISVVLRYVEGLPSGTAAAVCGRTEDSVRMQCVRAVRILRRALADLAPNDAPTPDNLLSLAEASARTGRSVAGFWSAIKEHRLTGYYINGRWMVTADAVDAFVAAAKIRQSRPHRARPATAPALAVAA